MRGERETIVNWCVRETADALGVAPNGEGLLHALAKRVLLDAAKSKSGIMLPDGSTPRFLGHAVAERQIGGTARIADVTADVETDDGAAWLVFEVNSHNNKTGAYNRDLAAQGVRGVEIDVDYGAVFDAMQSISERPLPAVTHSALRRVLLAGSKANRRWLGAGTQTDLLAGASLP